MKINYQLQMESEIKNILMSGKTPKLLLHSCCGPCSSYVIDYLTEYFDIDVYFYNPNIYPKDEYLLRKKEQIRLINELESKNHLGMIDDDYNYELFKELSSGMDDEPEGGLRCRECIYHRMEMTAVKAKVEYDYFTTTLSVSPHKNSQLINKLGLRLAEKHGAVFLVSDFKKKEGYKKSIELSKAHNLYRQDYCGCEFSKIESDKRKEL